MENEKIIELGGTRFRVEVVNEGYTRLVPVSDPWWLLRACEAAYVWPKGQIDARLRNHGED